MNCKILWALPKSEMDPDQTVLSFLDPIMEYQLVKGGGIKEVVTMSKVMDAVSSEAREVYLDLVADIGLYTLPDGSTLREALAYKSQSSLWWYHPVAFRNSESDPTYTNILSLLAIVREAKHRGVNKLFLVMPPSGFAESLQSLFSVVVENSVRPTYWLDLARGLRGRLKWTIRAIQTQLALKRDYKRPHKKFDVVLQGFWDWSVSPIEGTENELSDRYFVNLPNELRKRGKTVGYWCRYDPAYRPDSKERTDKEVLEPLKKQSDVVLLESLLDLSDIVLAALDFRPLLTFLRIHWRRSFLEVFMKNGLTFFPILRWPLLHGFVSSALPQWSLLQNSVDRVCSKDNPQLLICFLEHFPHSRATYAGLKGRSSKSWAIQHASYNQGKTHGALHQSKEFDPQEDGHSVPHPYKICVMGQNGERLFRGCGYSSDQVLLTGSTRFEKVRLRFDDRNQWDLNNPSDRLPKKVLIATSLPASTEFKFVQAVVEAAKGFDKSIILRLREHPLDKMEKTPGYSNVTKFFEVSSGSLEEDLKWADLVLISQSTVGEEAFINGKTVWQFRFPHPDQSALAEVAAIPRFCTVTELRKAFIDLASSSEIFKPDKAQVEKIYRSLFQTEKEKPSVAIAQAICKEFN